MAETIETVSIAEEVRERFLTYAMSVVKGRALPDVRDGLKPVQRRILYAMYNDLNLTVEKKSLKCAKIVGEVMGNYHPHGDGALYEALVRMTQSWVLRVPLVLGQGNFGSVDGDPPAAYRYTEAKLTRPAELLLGELDSETVDLNANYDGTRREPGVLPAQFPNLLVNGTAGIAVGMATQIPPHNLAEVLKACVLLIDEPDSTVANLLDRVKGPDFPLGGKIVTDRSTLRKIYEEGTGTIKVQGEWKEEKLERDRRQIVITSIPYGVNKGELENVIGGIIDQRKLPQLTGQSNESNEKDGLRLVLEVKPGTDPNLVMAYLYKHTELQKTYSYNMTALVPSDDGKTMVPKDGLSLKDLIRHFLDFRLVTVRKRFEYQLRQLRKRIHILEGFAIVFNALDEAIKIIRNSTDKKDAAEKLMARFKLDHEQVTAILDAQLYKIAQMEIRDILNELKDKKEKEKEIESILASKKKLWGVIKGEMEALIEKFPERRKTRMASDEDVLEFDEEAYIARENTNVVLTRNGWVKRVGRLAAVESTRVQEGDEVVAVVPGSTLDHVAFFADDGTAYTMRINEVPATAGYGEPITKFFKLGDGVKVVTAVTTDPRFTPADWSGKGDTPGGPYVIVGTRNGFVLRTPLAAFRVESTKNGRRFAKLEEGDKVVMVRLVGAEEGVMLATAGGYVTHFPLDQVTILAGVGRGVFGIKLDPDDECLGGVLVGGRFDKLVLETESGKSQEFGRVAIKCRARGGKGDKQGVRIKFARVIPPPIELTDWEAVEGKKPKDDAKGGE
jgi:DNA gyrase subunit A